MLKFIKNFARHLLSKIADEPAVDPRSVLRTFDEEELLAAQKTIEDGKRAQKLLQQIANRQKRDFFEKALQGGIASLHFDARVEGVEVPENFRGASHLKLNYSYRFHIADFCITDDDVVASLSFSGIPHRCVVPWHSVFGVGNQGENRFYQFSTEPAEDLPKEEEKHVGLRVIVNDNPITAPTDSSKKTPQLRLIKGEKT